VKRSSLAVPYGADKSFMLFACPLQCFTLSTRQHEAEKLQRADRWNNASTSGAGLWSAAKRSGTVPLVLRSLKCFIAETDTYGACNIYVDIL